MIKLSFIVPFYNVEPYIEECVRSLYNQDIPQKDYEVICIDDCSPDGSCAIVERLQREYPTLRLIRHNENKCQGGARNTGVKVAKGKYIWFVDSDDRIAPNCLHYFIEELYNNQLDLLQFDYKTFSDEVFNDSSCTYDEGHQMTGTDFVLSQHLKDWAYCCPIPWNKIINRYFWINHNLHFVEHMKYEDTELFLYMYPLVQRMKCSNNTGYYYRINPQSTTHQSVSGLTMWYRVMQLHRCLPAYQFAPNEDYRDLVAKYLHSELGQFRIVIKEMNKQERINYISRILRENISALRMFCNWRTWFAIKYGVCWFIPK